MQNPDPVIIRKYENRRLYDTHASRYVNLEEIAELIRAGTEVRVVDAKTGEDVTRVVLMQIITENAREQPTGLPLELLRQLILASDKAGQEFLMWYLRSAFDTYQKVRDAVQNRLGEIPSSFFSPLQMMSSFVPGASPAPPRQSEAELSELRRRIAELEARLSSGGAAPKPRRGRKAQGSSHPGKREPKRK